MAIIFAVCITIILCFLRLHTVLALVSAAAVAALIDGLGVTGMVASFTTGIANASTMVLSYALIGAFICIISTFGITEKIAYLFCYRLNQRSGKKWLLLISLLLMSIASQNLIPVHIAFIPIVIPPLLLFFNQLKLDRRMVACIMTFGIVCSYTIIPVGFGQIYMERVLAKNLALQGVASTTLEVMCAMLLPAAGMLVGLLFAVFVSYRKPRTYKDLPPLSTTSEKTNDAHTLVIKKKTWCVSIIALITLFIVQITTSSMILGALIGCLVMYLGHPHHRVKIENAFANGLKMMAPFGFVMMSASGLAAVLQDGGSIPTMVNTVLSIVPNKGVLIFLMLLVGLLITMGIGSSFSTVPIIATIYVPIAIHMGCSTMAIIALIGTAGVLGDAGSPASDSTLGPTSGLDMDKQHNHMYDTVIPTFLHYNIPLLIAGWAAVMLL